MKTLTLKALLVIGLFALTFTACKKDKSATPETDEVTATDNQIADDASTDAVDQFNIVTMNEIAVQDANSTQVNTATTLTDTDKRRTSGTVTISPIGTSYPKTITIDFGTGTTDNGITRKGKIVGILTGPWWVAGTTLTITFTNFYRNDNKVEGSIILTSNGFSTDKSSYSYNVVVDKNRINADGKTITWSSNRTITYYNNNTLTHLDDWFTVKGSASGTNRDGVTFTTTITKELKKFVTYRYFVSGIVEHKVGAKATVTLDYGDGAKDNTATLSVEGKTKIITLK